MALLSSDLHTIPDPRVPRDSASAYVLAPVSIRSGALCPHSQCLSPSRSVKTSPRREVRVSNQTTSSDVQYVGYAA